MSDETQANPLFADFKPPASPEVPMTFTEAPAVPGKPRTLKAEAPAVPGKPRTLKAEAAPKPPKRKRKPKPPKQPTSPEQPTRPKFDLQTILRAMTALKEDDYPAFEPLLNTFNAMSKPQRERVLAAIVKVFA